MLPTINLSLNRNFSIKNFEEDKKFTLNLHKGLRYVGKVDNHYKFHGDFYLINPQDELIESFELDIFIAKSYPYTFPIVVLLDDKVEKTDDYHISSGGIICFEHTYVTNALAKRGVRLYDFINYFMPKYFSWVLIKKHGDARNLQEWAHGNNGTIQFYESLLRITDKNAVRIFLENYCNASKINRNDKCYCGNGKKIKRCHLDAAQYLKATSKQIILNDITLFK